MFFYLVTNEVTRWVTLVEERALLVIDANKDQGFQEKSDSEIKQWDLRLCEREDTYKHQVAS